MEYKHALTKEEERRLTARAAKDPQHCAMLRMVWNAGLTVAETAALRWEDVDLSVPCLRVGKRTVPLVPEAAAALKRLGGRGEWVFPSRRNAGEPMVRMTISRELRRLLDGAGLPGLQPRDLRNLYLLRVLEDTPLEEAVRITGVEAVTLRDNWREYGRGEPPRPKPAGSTRPDDLALERALEEEGDTLDGRVIRLCWQGGLYLRDLQTLRWDDIAPDWKSWTIKGTVRPVPALLRPWLEEWCERGGEYVAAGPRSGRPLDEATLSRRTAIFFSHHGMEGMSVQSFRGSGQVEDADLERVMEQVRRRGCCLQETARKALGLTPNQMCAAVAALRRAGRLEAEEGERLRLPGARTVRERFYGALEESDGETVSAMELRKRSDIYDANLYYYIKEAEAAGRLRKAGYNQYRIGKKGR